MLANSVSIVIPAAICLMSLAEINAQSVSVGWPVAKTAPDTVNVVDARPPSRQPSSVAGVSRSDKKRIEPDPADRVQYHDLLEKEGFGLVKLLNVNCGGDGPLVVRVGDCSDSIPGHGADYSFRQGRHVYSAIADLKLDGGRLIVGSVMTQGLLISIGKVDIQKIDASSEALKFLTNFVPAADTRAAQQQTLMLTRGIWKNGVLCRATAPVVEGQTYLMRTIAYKTRDDGVDKRRDLIVAFTIVRQDADGNVTLIWKALRSSESPRIYLPE